jgi:hypothetical protein
MPRHSYGRTVRARRPRPSEETGLHTIPGPSAARPCSVGRPPRGGAGSARPQGKHGLHRGMCPVGQGPLASSSGQNGTPRHSWGLTARARRPRPSEKTALRAVSGLSRKASHPGLPPGGAGSARPQGGHALWLARRANRVVGSEKKPSLRSCPTPPSKDYRPLELTWSPVLLSRLGGPPALLRETPVRPPSSTKNPLGYPRLVRLEP